MKKLGTIVSPQFDISPELLLDWERQFRTAEAISARFANGYRTQLLADEVGMGKTYVAMAAMAHHIFQTTENDRKVLLVVPNSTILSRKWGQELRSFNEQYLSRTLRGRCSKRLRPLLVDDYWDLIENLHDYENEDLSRITETPSQCIAQFFYSWWKVARRRKGTRLRAWPDTGNLEEDAPALFDFASRFSRRAFHEFLDGKALMDAVAMDQLVKALESGESRKEELKGLFREFAKDQDTHESNVFVMTMKALGKSRRDHVNSRLLNTWMTSRILVGRRTTTRERILSLLDDANLVTRSADVSGNFLNWFNGLANVNLWGMAKVFDHVIELHGGTASLFDSFKEETCVRLLGNLHDEVIRAKLTEAGIGMAVVDEAHNWKNASNGAQDFAKAYAPFIKHKLLLSATPFQLDQEELGRIFKLAGGGEELFGPDKSLATVQTVLDHGLAAECLRESDAFQKAWQALSAGELNELEVIAARVERSTTECILSATGSHSIEPFLERFRSYAKAVVRLQGELSKVMLRHVKDRSHRHFHAGKDWLAEGLPLEPVSPRSGLYPVDGFADPRHALLGYVGMRLVQKLCRGKGTGNARLLRGITSSFAAFQASNEATLKATNLPDDVRSYLGFFESALAESNHPKVVATADRAFANYQRGSKTLIFCERVPTLKEIEQILIEKMGTLFPDGIPAAQKRRTALLRNQSFVDLHWSRSLFHVMPTRRQKELRALWVRDRAEIVKSLIRDIVQSGKIATERRVGRLIDLEFLKRMDIRELPSWAVLFRNPSDDNRSFLVEGTLPVEAESSGGAIDPEDVTDEKHNVLAREIVEESVEKFLDHPNLWLHAGNAGFHLTLQGLLASELAFLERQDNKRGDENRSTAFFGMLVDLVQGMRKILLRPELFAIRDMAASDLEVRLLRDLWEAPDMGQAPAKSSPGKRLEDFLRILATSEGTIQRRWMQDSKRKSLWSGVFIHYNETAGLVMTLDGSVSAETRVRRCAAFNSPLAPDILICTAIGAEGIDLHRYCSEVIHHDLPWNPAKLEQRIGRIDRVGSLNERNPGIPLLIGIPFLANDYETIQYQVLQGRAQRFEVLLGKPDFSLEVEEEDQEDKIKAESEDEEFVVEAGGVLPLLFMERLRMDLRVQVPLQ